MAASRSTADDDHVHDDDDATATEDTVNDGDVINAEGGGEGEVSPAPATISIREPTRVIIFYDYSCSIVQTRPRDRWKQSSLLAFLVFSFLLLYDTGFESNPTKILRHATAVRKIQAAHS